jgi:hypothetical protein
MGKWQGVILGGGVMLVLAGAAIALGSGRASGQAGTAVISIDPPSTQVAPDGGQVNININISNVQNLGAFELTLKYNPEVLDFLGAADTGFLTTTGRSEQCVPAISAPDAGIVRFGCNTLGLVENGVGEPGPDGSGTLAIASFSPKAIGNSDITLVGLDDYYVYTTNGNTEHGQTSLDAVEVCPAPGQCASAPIAFTATTGVIAVIDPAAATPTALAPTPTPEPRASRTPDRAATARAVLGTPERTLGDNNSSNPGSGTLTLPGPDGVLGTADDVQSPATLPGPDGVLGTSDDVAASGVRGLPNTSGGTAGASGSVPGATRGPNGAPIAGYGPQDHQNPWPQRFGVAMILAGALAVAAGLTVRGDKRRA